MLFLSCAMPTMDVGEYRTNYNTHLVLCVCVIKFNKITNCDNIINIYNIKYNT